MEYRYLGSSGLKVSQACLGTMTFGREADEQTSTKMIDHYREAGGNFLDTADSYGPKGQAGTSEMVVGRALKGKRHDFVISTKVGFPTGPGANDLGLSRAHIFREVEASLRRLQTDYIDVYHVHCWDEGTPLEETLSALNTLVSTGKVRYLGGSNFAAWQIMKALAVCDNSGWPRFVSAQMQYSLLMRDIEREILPLCDHEGLSVIAWGPLGGGFLTGKYQTGVAPPHEGRVVTVNENEEEAWIRRATERNFQIVEAVGEVARSLGVRHANVALAWLLARGVIPIIGARDLDHLETNLKSIDLGLSPVEAEKLERASWIDLGYPYRFIREVFPDRRQ